MKLARHTFFNLVGLGAPLLVAVAAIPVLIQALGPERFGLLTLIWAITSYFGLFDLGLGRALTQQLVIVLDRKEIDRIGPLCATALALMGLLGLVGGALLMAIAPWAVDLIQQVPDRREAILCTVIMGLALPAITLTAGLRGVLEAKHEFAIINAIRVPMGVWTFGAPCFAIWLSGADLIGVAMVLALGRWIALVAHGVFVHRVLVPYDVYWKISTALVKPLSVSGGWLTVSNVISPFMGYADRFIIGAVVSTSAVAFYTTPQELVTKLWIVPGALTAVLFPTFAAQISQRNEAALKIYKEALFWLVVTMLPLTLGVALFAQELLNLWVGADFAMNSTRPLKLFAFGMFVSCLAQVPFTIIQSAGRSKITALIHSFELPIFLIALAWLATYHGIEGAALAWTLRVVVDALVMTWACGTLLGSVRLHLLKWSTLVTLILCGGAFLGVMLQPVWQRVIWLFITCLIVFIVAIVEIHRGQCLREAS